MLFKLCLAALLSGQAADAATTVRLMQHPAAYHEANVLLPQSPAGIVAVKAGMTTGLAIAGWKVRQQRPKLAIGLFLLGAASGWYGTEHNLRLPRR